MINTSPVIGILRYSAGNSGSVARALTRLGISWRFVDCVDDLASIAGLIFPGAGAAKSAMKDLRNRGFIEAIKSYKKPFLGICLGMQLLFDLSEEGQTKCLGIISGKVRELPDAVVKPHMGWNMLKNAEQDIGYAYFVHSFVCEPSDKRLITMTTDYGTELCAAVRYKNFFGVQWHPEKSSGVGDAFLRSFASLVLSSASLPCK